MCRILWIRRIRQICQIRWIRQIHQIRGVRQVRRIHLIRVHIRQISVLKIADYFQPHKYFHIKEEILTMVINLCLQCLAVEIISYNSLLEGSCLLIKSVC